MKVLDMLAVTHRSVETNGNRMHLAEAGSGPLILLLRGFPELWYSWRQLPALADAGYHAVAPEVGLLRALSFRLLALAGFWPTR